MSFLRRPEDSLVGTFALVPQVVDAVGVPVIAAGGVADRRGVAAAFALGASGVQVGTAFLRARESAATEGHRRAIAEAGDTGTVLTRAMSGRLARGIPNRALREIETSGMIAPFPAQNWLTGVFRAAAARSGDADLLSLWAGQASALAVHESAAEVFAELRAGVPRVTRSRRSRRRKHLEPPVAPRLGIRHRRMRRRATRAGLPPSTRGSRRPAQGCPRPLPRPCRRGDCAPSPRRPPRGRSISIVYR